MPLTTATTGAGDVSVCPAAAALKGAMEARFPGLGMGVALDIGSKVAKGEMKWG